MVVGQWAIQKTQNEIDFSRESRSDQKKNNLKKHLQTVSYWLNFYLDFARIEFTNHVFLQPSSER